MQFREKMGQWIKRIRHRLNCGRLMLIRTKRQDTLDLQRNLEKWSVDTHSSCIVSQRCKTGERYQLDIIIPAYNVEKYIDKCICSVLKQETKYKYRIIIIEDFSTDHTRDILEKYMKQYDNIILVCNQENYGIAKSRNIGLNVSNSDYVMFLDSDDMLLESAIEVLLDKAYSLEYDIVEGGHIEIDEGDRLLNIRKWVSGDVNAFHYFRGEPWGKVIKSSFFSRIQFPEGYWYEDTVFKLVIYPMAKRACGVEAPVYGYRLHKQRTSVTSSYYAKCLDAIYIHLQMYQDREQLGIEANQAYYEYLIGTSMLIYHRTKKMPEEVKKTVFLLFANFIRDSFPKYRSKTRKQLDYAIRHNCYEFFMRIYEWS